MLAGPGVHSYARPTLTLCLYAGKPSGCRARLAGTPGCCRWRRARGARRRRPRPRWPRALAAAATTWRSCARSTAGRPRAPAAGPAASARTRPRTASAAAPWPCWTACAGSCSASSRRARYARACASTLTLSQQGSMLGRRCGEHGVSNRQGAAGERARLPARDNSLACPGRGGRRGAPLRPRARRAQARGFIASLAGASRNAADAGLVRSVLAAGFYPQVRALNPLQDRGYRYLKTTPMSGLCALCARCRFRKRAAHRLSAAPFVLAHAATCMPAAGRWRI